MKKRNGRRPKRRQGNDIINWTGKTLPNCTTTGEGQTELEKSYESIHDLRSSAMKKKLDMDIDGKKG